MSWFLIALATPVLHSVANLMDKFILSKYFKDFSLLVFMIYYAFTTVMVLPIFLIFGGLGIFHVPLNDILILIIAGLCGSVAAYFYLFSLFREEASGVIPFFQLVPVISFFLGWGILGETLTLGQIIGSAVVIFGSVILSLEFGGKEKLKFKKSVVLAMVVVSLLTALGGILFKFSAAGNDFWISNFWEYIGFSLVYCSILFFRKKERQAFYSSVKEYGFRIIWLILLSEILIIIGALALNYAFLLAPVVLVRVVEGSQPAFVLILGILITLIFPKILKEKLHWQHLLPKILAILIILVGSFFILD